jgi:hypothetical protein
MGNARTAVELFAVNLRLQLTHPRRATGALQRTRVMHSNAAGVIAAILQAL